MDFKKGKIVTQITKKTQAWRAVYFSKAGVQLPPAAIPKCISPKLKSKIETEKPTGEFEIEVAMEKGQPACLRLPGEDFTPQAAAPTRAPTQAPFRASHVAHHAGGHMPHDDFGAPYNGDLPGSAFVYPYNFVRIDTNRQVERQSPAGHERFIATLKSGKLTITLTPQSPWFIPDSHHPDTNDRESHKTYPYLRDPLDSARPALPVTSIKGMLRSTFETLTNSCFSVFSFARNPPPDSIKDYMGLRYNPKRQSQKNMAPRFKPARIIEEGNSLYLKRMQECTHWVPRGSYDGTDAYDRVFSVPETPSHNPNAEKYRLDPVTNMLYRIARSNDLGIMAHPDSSGTPGYLKRSWALQDVKQHPQKYHHERVFTDIDSDPIELTGENHKAVEAYDRIIDEQKDLIKPKGGKPAAYDLQRDEQDTLHHLAKGDLVYFSHHRGYLEISRTAIPRISSRHSVGQLLPESLHPCNDASKLCPACRLFGMVAKGKSAHPAYRGQLRLGATTWLPTDTKKWSGTKTNLKVLSTPHPESTNFYLVDKDRENKREVDYDTPGAQLRGRKRYWTRKDVKPGDYTIRKTHPCSSEKKSNQSITAELLNKDDGAFSCTLHFENLQDWELGALLFTLELPWSDGAGFHQIGHGKPLGLGLCRVEVSEVRLLNAQARYSFSSPEGGWSPPMTKEEQKTLLEAFQTQIAPGQRFEALPSIADLKLLTQAKDGAIRYPNFAVNTIAQMGEKTFAWFNGDFPKLRDGNLKSFENPDVQIKERDKLENVEKLPAGGDSNRVLTRRDIPLPLPEEAETRQYHGDDGPDARLRRNK